MWEQLNKYLKDKKILELGCGMGQKTAHILNCSENVTSIDISKESIDIAKEKYKNTTAQFLIMNASELKFEDKSFDVIITTDSFHEMNPEIQNKVLDEMIRCSDTLIFIEPDEISVTNELFKVFDPNENHSLRIKNSMEKAFNSMKNNNYKLLETGSYKDITTFSSKKEMDETLLDWWNDIKVPKDDNEKKKMINEIERILLEFDMLDKKEVFEEIHYYVFSKEEK